MLIDIECVEFPKLLEHLKNSLPKSLTAYLWVDLRIQNSIRNLGIKFSEYHCLVDRWPCPQFVICCSKMKLPNSDFHSFIGVWSELCAEETFHSITESIKLLGLNTCAFRGIDKQVGEMLSKSFGANSKLTDVIQYWIPEKAFTSVKNDESKFHSILFWNNHQY